MVLPKQRPESPNIEMLIDKARGWNVLLDDVDKVQSDLDLLNKFTDDAAKQINIAVDAQLLSAVGADAAAANIGSTAGAISGSYSMGVAGAPVQITKVNIVDYITYAGGILDEQNVPDDGRWLVLPSWMVVMLKGSDLKDASMTGDSKSPLRNGLIGMIDRFRIYSSNSCGTAADASGFTAYYALFGNNDAISFANQFTKTESLRSTDSFDTIVRGLMVWGYKVVKPEALGYLYARK